MSMRRLASFALTCIASVIASPASSAGFDSQRLAQLIAEQRVTTIERALELLPFSLRSRYALVFKSRSLQEASFAEPRVILFGDDARFIVTFNGHPDQHGFNALEVMEYDDHGNRFLFREFLFPGPSSQTSEGSSPDLSVVVSEPNPAKCVACHGSPARPIWDTHPTWPGAYGEQYGAPLSRAEQDGLSVFLSAQATHPRFRSLKNVKVFADPNTFAPSAKFLYSGTETEAPNVTLSRLLSNLNARVIAREVSASPRFAAYQYALLGAVSPGCGSVDAYFTGPLSAGLAQGYPEFATRARQSTAQQSDLKRSRMQPRTHVGSPPSDADIEQLVQFRYLAEAALGISSGQWTLAMEKGTFDFNSPRPFSDELDRQLRALVAQSDASIQDLASLREIGAGDKYCRNLQAKSRSATKELRADDELNAARTRIASRDALDDAADALPHVPALQTCIACHQGVVGPSLPFAQPQALGKSLMLAGYPRGTLLSEILFRLSPTAGQEHMPRGVNLADQERRALEDYFSALAGAPPR